MSSTLSVHGMMSILDLVEQILSAYHMQDSSSLGMKSPHRVFCLQYVDFMFKKKFLYLNLFLFVRVYRCIL